MARKDVSSDDGGAVCVLLFSGGRDSTVAAVRLHRRGYRLVLLTVATDHLVGLSAVRQRLFELRAQLPPSTRFIHVSAHPREEIGGTSKPTCLPCQLTYLTAGVVVARSISAVSLAFGYVGYGTGDLEPNDHIWTLTDQQLIERLMASRQPSVRSAAEGWLVGHLWPIAEPLWLRGAPPPFRDLVDFNEVISDELGRHCFAYRIKDKRHRTLRLPLASGRLLTVGEDSDRWLLAIASRLAKSFTGADNRRITQVACSHFGTSIVDVGHASMTGASLFDNAT